MTGDQWFTLWMTIVQTVGGGAVTLGGVFIGFKYAKRQAAHAASTELARADAAYWVQAMQELLAGLRVLFKPRKEDNVDPAPAEMTELVDQFQRAWIRRIPLRGSNLHRLMSPVHSAVHVAPKTEEFFSYRIALNNLLLTAIVILEEQLRLEAPSSAAKEGFEESYEELRKWVPSRLLDPVKLDFERLWT